jgi:quinolinate synthase
VAESTDVTIIPWEGRCIVHEEFTAEQLRAYRAQFPGIVIIAHPECPYEVLEEADMVGSTSQMSAFVERERPQKVALITECSMSDNVAAELPELELVRPCSLCPHMKKITLANIRDSLTDLVHEVTVSPEVADGARRAVERMLAVGRGGGR